MATLTHVSNDVQRAKAEVETISAAQTLTEADSGKVLILNAAAGATITLPALGSGLRFKFVVGAAFATTNWVVDSAEGDNINGILVVNGASVAASGEDQVDFVASAESIGDYIELVCDGSQWLLSGVGSAAGSITTTDPS
ncbi:hypothetical protein D8Z79_025805 (plasmid) [Escherichia fergusonii]|uniref:DUF2190 family protein n=1 Tax=Lysinibacillus pakistanensis TaxID=759811 RepID=A0ABX6DGX2_9BACI|nr:hypothetical protein [Escherichia fergusonii]QCZ35015.1 hypothetical protein D8Z79_025580 [Escherichia fergusonii]QCZ35059.1 hypothetical protein D8Z79_025805 [Escherichia fergusonii]QGG54065.1 hypothetical protein GDS87_24405 [Lysinibacillus pakistanensis]QGG54119.1 hypothetical protein GDS87_24680 [Lysinibacillus pakistanensis]